MNSTINSKSLKWFSLIFALFTALYSVEAYTFSEELFVESLPDSLVQLHFQFNSIFNPSSNENSKLTDYELFPKSIGDIISQFKINEIKLALSQGTWKYNSWGIPTVSVPTGAELWAKFDTSVPKENIDSVWLEFSRTISGLFGLSINLRNSPNTVQPRFSFGSSQNDSDYMRYASMPSEFVCTENLTPWIKLLPCGRSRGLSSLFKRSNKIFEANYLATILQFKKTCLDEPRCNKVQLELKQTLVSVYDLETISKSPLENSFPWTFSNIYEVKLTSVCPIANISKIYFDLADKTIIDAEPSQKILSKEIKRDIYEYDLQTILSSADGSKKEFNPIIVNKKDSHTIESHISIHRFISDKNERNFGLTTVIKNSHPYDRYKAIYLDTVPWYFRVYISTLEIRKNKNFTIEPELVKYSPGLDRKRAHHIELIFSLDPNSVTTITLRAEYAYLKWDEYPPDVNHGFFINPALITVKSSNNRDLWAQFRSFTRFSTIHDSLYSSMRFLTTNNRIYKLYTEALLVNLPAPDFSMPYNVICLVCTVVAIGFGSLHNFTTRRFIFVESKTFKEKLIHLLHKITKIFSRK